MGKVSSREQKKMQPATTFSYDIGLLGSFFKRVQTVCNTVLGDGVDNSSTNVFYTEGLTFAVKWLLLSFPSRIGIGL